MDNGAASGALSDEDRRWAMYHDCEADPGDEMTLALAYEILALHRHIGWQPCLPRLAALSYLSETDE